jgi:amphi-Trp domain-containing protein
VSDLELERKESMTRAEAAKRLSAFAAALASGDKIELDLGGTSVTFMHVADDVRTEFEVQVDGDEIEVEIELSWSTSGRERSGGHQRDESASRAREGERAT